MMKKNNKKNKKIIMTVTGGGFLVATSLAITIPVVLVSFNNDQQDVQNAKQALEKLTTTQKTVDLTKSTNQKLPSVIGPTITSIKALHALIKGVIIVPNGITYTPQVIKTNNAKGEIVVEIKIQKGAVRATMNFTIAGFTTTSQVQANLETALAKVGANTISGDVNQLPSSMTSISIGTLKGFPQTTTNGVSFSATPKTPIDAAGTLTITLTATKGDLSKAKELTIRDFKKQSNEDAVKEALAKIVTNTISGDVNKLPSQMTPTLIKALTGFPKTTSNGVSFSVTIKNNGVDDVKSKLVVILTATKGSNTKAKELTISDFQTQTQANRVVVNAYKELISGTTTTTTKVLNKLSSMVTYTDITDFNAKTNANLALPIEHIHVDITSISNDGEQIVTFTISTKDGETATHTIIVTKFKKKSEQANDDIQAAKVILDNLEDTTIADDSKNVFKTAYTDLDDFFKQTTLSDLSEEEQAILQKVNISLYAHINANFVSQKLQLVISTTGGVAISSYVEITGFKKSQERVDISIVYLAKSILKKYKDKMDDDVKIIDTNKTVDEVTYNDLADFFVKTTFPTPNDNDQAILKKVTIKLKLDLPHSTDTQSLKITFSNKITKPITMIIEIHRFKKTQ